MAGIDNRDKELVHGVLIHLEDLVELGTCLLDLHTKTCCLTWSGICIVMLEVNEMGVRVLDVFDCTEISQMTNLAVRIALVGWHCGLSRRQTFNISFFPRTSTCSRIGL
jgi:hypothetical protein